MNALLPSPRTPLSPISDEASVPGLSAWTWEQLEAELLALAQTPQTRLMVSHLVEGVRRQARFLTKAGVAREIATIIFAVVDPSFPEEASTMT